MSTRPFQYLCVHGHFYQPPRGNPVTNDTGAEPDAGKYRNWNERITAESYRPNAEIGNFDRISFDVGISLLTWLRKRAPETYQRIVQADRLNLEQKKIGNAVGTTFHHTIMPLRKRRDKESQLAWGKATFKYYYGRDPEGLWLPELAVDLETLQMVEAAGYKFTIVAQGQLQNHVDGAGPYWVDLQNGRKLAVFVRQDELSNDLSFNIGAVGGAGHWARLKLGRRVNKGLLTLLAVGGETFGHHHLGEERFLHWLITHEAAAVGYRMITLNEFYRLFEPRETIAIRDFSSWNSSYNVARWCWNTVWKSLMLRALDTLSAELDELYMDVVRPLGVDPWQLRNEYVSVWLGGMEGPKWLAQYAPGLTNDVEQRVLNTLQAVLTMARSYNSNTFDFDEFDRVQPRYSIANAAYAAYLAQQATGVDLGTAFRHNLKLVRSETTDFDGAQAYDEAFDLYITPPEEVAQPTADDTSVVNAASDTTPPESSPGSME